MPSVSIIVIGVIVIASFIVVIQTWRHGPPSQVRTAERLRSALAEHPEFYFVFAVGVVVLAAHLLGWVKPEIIVDVILAALIAFTAAMLRFLHRLGDRERPRPDEILLDDYPASYLSDLDRATGLWITGTNLRRIFPDYTGRLEKLLARGGTIHAVLAKPGSDASKYGAFQEYGYSSDETQQAFSSLIDLSYGALEKLRERAPGRVTIVQVDFPIYFGIDAVNVRSPDGVIYVRFYPIAAQDRPIVVLRPYETRWFEFYKRQLLDLTGEINPASSNSVQAITALANKIAYSNLSEKQKERCGFLIPYTEDEYRKFVRLADHFYVLTLHEKIVGFLLAHSSDRFRSYHDEEVYEHIVKKRKDTSIIVRQICIDPEYLNRGFGRKLYDCLIEKVREEKGAPRTAVAFIWERPPNPVSEQFHQSLGWTKTESYELTKRDPAVGPWEAVGIWEYKLW